MKRDDLGAEYETELRFGTSAKTEAPKPPSYDVSQKQDAGHMKSDFHRDLAKATRRVKRPT